MENQYQSKAIQDKQLADACVLASVDFEGFFPTVQNENIPHHNFPCRDLMLVVGFFPNQITENCVDRGTMHAHLEMSPLLLFSGF